MALTLALGDRYGILAALASSRCSSVLREESAGAGMKNRTISIKIDLREIDSLYDLC